MAIWFTINRLVLITRYFGHPFKSFSAMQRLEKLRRSFLGDHTRIKIAKAGGYYYYDLNSPGFPSRIFNRYYLSELNKLYGKQPATDMKALLFGITKKCPLECEHCYEWDELNKKETLTNEVIERVIDRFQQRGVYQVQFGGGEPLSRIRDIEKIVPQFNQKSDFILVTSGFNLSRSKLERLKKSGLRGLTISLDHFEEEKHDAVRGREGSYRWVLQACSDAVDLGFITGLSLCATREFLTNENLMKYVSLGRDLGVGFIQIVEPRAVGHYAGKNVELNDDQKAMLRQFYEEMNFGPDNRDFPIITYHGYHQSRVGCVGAGNRFLYVDTNGELKACPFCGSAFGNALTADLDEVVARMQAQGCGAFRLAKV